MAKGRVTVIFWVPRNVPVKHWLKFVAKSGHVSIQTYRPGSDVEAEYMSFWPDNSAPNLVEKLTGVVGKFREDQEEDEIYAKEHNLKKVFFHLEMLDVDKINRKFQKLKKNMKAVRMGISGGQLVE